MANIKSLNLFGTDYTIQGIVDVNLANQGIAADAKATGDAIETLRSQIGSPLVASNTSQMSDHTRVYVYTGTQTGYTAGNWYYWNGSAWTSGGVYNSVAVETDKTLSVSGQAADAAEAGKVKGDLFELVDSVGTDADTISWIQGSINSNNGNNATSSVRVRSGGYFSFSECAYIAVRPGTLIYQIFEYTSTPGTYVGSVTNAQYVSGDSIYAIDPNHYYRFVVSNSSETTITPSDALLAGFKVTKLFNIDEFMGTTNNNFLNIIKSMGFNSFVYDWQQGGISANNGAGETDTSLSTYTKRVRNSGYMHPSKPMLIYCPERMKFRLFEYSSDDLPSSSYYIGIYGNKWHTAGTYIFNLDTSHYFRIIFGYENNDDMLISNTELNNVITAEVSGDTVKAFDNMSTSDVGNVGILCAKEHNYADGSSPIYEWYLLGDPATNKVYFSKDLETKEYLFTFHERLGYWSFGIDKNNNIICCKQSEYLADTEAHDDSLRVNPVVYKASEKYGVAHTVNFGSNKKPCGWLSSVGFQCVNSGNVLIAEYTRPVVQTANIWKISGDPTDASNWSIKKTFTLSGSDTGFKHIHCIQQDFFTGVIYSGTGDDDSSSSIYYSTDDGNTWTAGKQNSEKYCRLVNIIFRSDYVYWTTDTNKQNMHFVFRATRNANGVINFSSIEDMLEIPLVSGLATYGSVYIPEYNALLLLERVDNITVTSMPVRLYDIGTNTLHTIATLETASGNPVHLGFRTRFCEWYPKKGVVNLAWHLRGTSIGSVGYNQNKMFGNQGTPDTVNNINNAYLRVTKDGSYGLVIGTRYI